MSKFDKYIFLPCFSLTPNKLALYNKVFIKNNDTKIIKSANEFGHNRNHHTKTINSENTINNKFHGFTLSDNAYRTLKKRIDWLYYLSKSRYVKTYRGKEIYNFKIGFYTFTLPSKQKTPTKDITNRLFNQLLTELRERTDMINYVWRLEFQKNGNVHYHMVSDTYLDYYFVRKIWNRILSKDGYISDYQNKFINLTLSEYNQKVNSKKLVPFNIIAKRYAKGKSDNWLQPNSVDCKSVISSQSISNYISKYFGKDSIDNPICNELDNEDNSKNMRLWFCSRSLSKMNTINNFIDAINWNAQVLIEEIKDVKLVISKYCSVYYFDIKKADNLIKKVLSKILKDYSKKQGYIPAI